MTTQRLFCLIRASLLGKEVDGTLFSSMTASDWTRLMDYASQQGVMAIAFEGLERSPVRPPMDQLMDWLGQASYIESCIDQKEEGLEELRRLYSSNGIDLLVLKGLSLCSLYPKQKVREFGDHDVYTFDKHEQANQLIRDLGVEIVLEDKHDVFDFAGVHIEHHNYFVDEYSKIASLTNDYLKDLAVRERIKVKDGLYYPSANFNAVYLLYHIISHLAYEGATLKNILDWGMFLHSSIGQEGDVNWEKTRAFYENVGLIKAFNTITFIGSRVLDEDFSDLYIGQPDDKLADKVMGEILDTTLHAETEYSTVKRIMKKTQRVWSHRWLYSSGLIPSSFWSYVKGSLKEHFEHPEQL